jgi:hypothetical protein
LSKLRNFGISTDAQVLHGSTCLGNMLSLYLNLPTSSAKAREMDDGIAELPQGDEALFQEIFQLKFAFLSNGCNRSSRSRNRKNRRRVRDVQDKAKSNGGWRKEQACC